MDRGELSNYPWLREWDRPAFERLKEMDAAWAVKPTRWLATSIRWAEEDLGLTPAARHRLKIQIKGESA